MGPAAVAMISTVREPAVRPEARAVSTKGRARTTMAWTSAGPSVALSASGAACGDGSRDGESTGATIQPATPSTAIATGQTHQRPARSGFGAGG